MTEKEKYSNMMNEIHVPSEVLGKVMNMKSETKTLNHKKLMHNLATAAAAMAVCFVASNGICYAASGQTWVETVKIYINGEETEQEIQYEQDGDKLSGTMTFDVDPDSEKGEFSISSEISEDGEVTDTINYNTDNYGIAPEAALETRGDALYFVIPDTFETDITEDFSDGSCEGSFTLDGTTYQYTITGDEQEYNIQIFY